jgi:hypothetical protein
MRLFSTVMESTSFWRRQFAPQPSHRQTAFDIAFGIAMPLICLYFDPGIFRRPVGNAELGPYVIVAGVAIALGFVSLTGWLVLRWPAALLAGCLSGGGIFALLLGIVLLPMSVLGVFFVIGILGFTPLATAFVFFRNAVRAYYAAHLSKPAVASLVTLGLVVTCGGPWVCQIYVDHETDRALEMVQSSDPAEVTQAISFIGRLRTLTGFNSLVYAYPLEPDEKRRERLAAAYQEMTGNEIWDELPRG